MDKIKNFFELGRAKGVKIVHLNIRSLFPKIEQLRALMADCPADILTVSETWLNGKYSDNMIKIQGYHLFRLDRENKPNGTKRGGGLATYTRADLAANTSLRPDLNVTNHNIEAQWIEVKREMARDILICNVYRPPTGNIKKAFESLNKALNAVDGTKIDIFITGDFNIDYKKKSNPAYKQLSFFEKANNLNQIIQNDTRITNKSSTLIDLILTNAKYISTFGTLDTFISDHQPIFVIKKKRKEIKQSQSFTGRSYKAYSKEHLTGALLGKDWREFYEAPTPDKKWSLLSL